MPKSTCLGSGAWGGDDQQQLRRAAELERQAQEIRQVVRHRRQSRLNESAGDETKRAVCYVCTAVVFLVLGVFWYVVSWTEQPPFIRAPTCVPTLRPAPGPPLPPKD